MSEGPLEGKTVVFTGTLDVTRRQARAIAHEVGADPKTTVSAKTDFLVAGRNAGSKLQEAADLGVTILSESAFFDKVREQRAVDALKPGPT